MGKITNAARAALGRVAADAPAAPPVIDLRARYVATTRQLADALWRGDVLSVGWCRTELGIIRAAADNEGFGEALSAIWVEPPLAGPGQAEWYAASLAHALSGQPDPGPRPFLSHEWGHWLERYKPACVMLLAAYRGRIQSELDTAQGQFWQLRRAAFNAGFGQQVERHFMECPAASDEATLANWECEAAFRLEHGRPSGEYCVTSTPDYARPIFVRASDLPPVPESEDEVQEREPSALVLLVERDGVPAGTLVHLDAAVSWDLVERREAAWSQPAKAPHDPRPRPEPAAPEPIPEAPPGYVVIKRIEPPRQHQTFFVTEAEMQGHGHSPVILLVGHGLFPSGTRLPLDPAAAWTLIEAGRAVWADPSRVPADTRPPVELEPGEDWRELHFLRPVRLVSRHQVKAGDVRRVAPAEAAALVEEGTAEPWAPPAPPPRPRVVFGDVEQALPAA